MGRKTERRALAAGLLLAFAAVTLLAAAGPVLAQNAYGQVFAGQARCLLCHGGTQGRWQVGRYRDTNHARQMVDVEATPQNLLPAFDGPLWPSPAAGGGLSFGPADVRWQLGASGESYYYISRFRNDGPHVLSTGMTMAPFFGPADDWSIFLGVSYNALQSTWKVTGRTSRLGFFQFCGGCHFTGVTRPSNAATTLASGAVMDRTTETSYAGMGVQCESCHGTGSSESTMHWTSGVRVVRTGQALESQTCGQCHADGTAKERNFNNWGFFSSPNGFTPDRKLSDFFDVHGTQYVKTSPYMPQPVIPDGDAKLYPSGHNEGMESGTYNEWLLSKHARSLRYANGMSFNPWGGNEDSCMACHSGEGFLQSIRYGKDGPNDMAIFGSSLASDKLDIECGVCHAVHAKTGPALGLRLDAQELCERCHTAAVAAGAEIAPGADTYNGVKELFGGYGLIGVPRMRHWMGDAECPDCHMPRTHGDSPSHRFKVMEPGDAEEWGVQEGGDSCTPCHRKYSREVLQDALEEHQADVESAIDEAKAAIEAAKSRAASTTRAGRELLACAETNVGLVEKEGSTGMHNHPYVMAGLEKAAFYADAVGARFTRFGATSYDPREKLSMAHGTLVLGDGSPAANQSVTIQAKPGGRTSWVNVARGKTGSDGRFSIAVAPNGTTSYRARWTARGSNARVVSGSAKVTFRSSTSIRVSSARIALGGAVNVTGVVSPGHSGQRVSVSYRLGSGRWRLLATPKLNGASTYGVTWRPPSRGTYYFRARFSGDPSHSGSLSPKVAVRVY